MSAPNQAWATDITYVRTSEGWLYLAVVIDLFSRWVGGLAVADDLRTELCLYALTMAGSPYSQKNYVADANCDVRTRARGPEVNGCVRLLRCRGSARGRSWG